MRGCGGLRPRLILPTSCPLTPTVGWSGVRHLRSRLQPRNSASSSLRSSLKRPRPRRGGGKRRRTLRTAGDARLAAQLSCSLPTPVSFPASSSRARACMNRRPENMFDLVRAGDGVKVCSSSRVTGGVSSVGCGKLFDFTGGRVCRPRRRAQCRRAFLARNKSFRFSDGFPRAMIIRMVSLEDRQHPSRACCCVKRDLPELIFPEVESRFCCCSSPRSSSRILRVWQRRRLRLLPPPWPVRADIRIC